MTREGAQRAKARGQRHEGPRSVNRREINKAENTGKKFSPKKPGNFSASFKKTEETAKSPYFTVVVTKPVASDKPNTLSTSENEILIVTQWNRRGYWWGIKAYDPSVAGWFLSDNTQPYVGEIPEKGMDVIERLKRGE